MQLRNALILILAPLALVGVAALTFALSLSVRNAVCQVSDYDICIYSTAKVPDEAKLGRNLRRLKAGKYSPEQ